MEKKLIWEIGLAYFLILGVILWDIKENYGVWKELVPVSLLAFFQLFLIGFVLLYLIQLHSVVLNLLVILIMTLNASFIASKRFSLKGYSRRKVFLSVFLSIASVNYFLLAGYKLLKIVSWDAHMLIPFAGLLIAAGMRSVSLFSYHLKELIVREREILEGFFALGAGNDFVRKYLLRKSIPTTTVVIRDMFKAAGIVHIPGVMVGLLMAGVNPLKAAAMQFLVLSSMLFSMFFTPVIFFSLLTKIEGIFLIDERTKD